MKGGLFVSPAADGPAPSGPRRAWFAPYVAQARKFVGRRPVVAAASVGAAFVLAGSGLSYAAVGHYTATISPVPAFEGLTDRPDDDAATNILVVGSDDRGGISTERRLELALGVEDFGRHTDTMLLVHLTSGGAVDVISIPRDSAVTIPAHTSVMGTDVEETMGKINTAYSSGGPPLLVQTVEDATGVHVDHYVEVNFEGFVDIVDALGGVEVCTDVPIDDELSGLVLPAGTSTVDGQMGLSYVRARYFDPMADYGRMQRQQAFLASMARKAASTSVLLNPFRANSTVNAALSSLSADPALNDSEVKRILRQLRGTSPGDVQFHSVPVAQEEYLDDGSLAVVWDSGGARSLFDSLRNDRSVLAQVTSGDESRTKDTDHAEAPTAPSVSLVVLNGNGTPGIATDAAAGFTTAGYSVISIGNAEQVSRTEIAYPPGAKEQAELIKELLPGAKLTESGDITDVTVTLGTDFKELDDLPHSPPTTPESSSPSDTETAQSGSSEPSQTDDSATESAGPIAGTGVGAGSGADSLCS